MPVKTSSILYWTLAVVLVAFGVVAVFSIGAPFLLIGLTLVFLWPARGRPDVFWSVLIGVGSFIVGYILAAPLGCTGEATESGGPGTTECFNLLGIDYSGSGAYNPPLWPSLLIGVAAGLVGASVTRSLAKRIQRDAGASVSKTAG